MSGLVYGLQNRLRRFESARHLKHKVGDKRQLKSLSPTSFFYISIYGGQAGWTLFVGQRIFRQGGQKVG